MEGTAEPATPLTPAPLSTVVTPTPFSAGFHAAPPSFDVIELLPPASAEKLRLLRQRSADAHTLIPEFEQIREASMAKIEAANALKRLTDHPQDFGFGLKDDDRRVLEAQRHLEKSTADFKRLQELQEARSGAWRAASGALVNVEAWLKGGRPGNATVEAVEVEPPKLNKGESITDGIERLRRRGRELKADAHRIRSAPFPSALCKAQMRSQVEALAMQGAPSVSSLVEHDGKISWSSQNLQSRVFNSEPGAVAFTEMPDAVALIAWLHKDALVTALDREIASEAEDGSALTHEQRQQQEAEVMATCWQLNATKAGLCGQRLSRTCRYNIGPTSRRSRCLACGWSPRRVLTLYPKHRRGFHGLCDDDIDRAAGAAACQPGNTAQGGSRLRAALRPR
jgi:hypothetical protein